ncbi:MAG TPA: glutathione S-transferase family protein [Hyphomonadaceae bacterium]|nr:glutathione S-transferase family protein [Hyphomonadaceae bacterium]HPN04850.1 glutathione S-transferase family protein [Hyphomonadaceae bacterium]
MITLSGFGPNFGLPEVSPYVTKTEVHLRMAGLAYEKHPSNPAQGPKGQLPFIEDGGRLIGDSTFIRMHLEREYGIDFDAGLSPLERATALAIELMIDRELSPASVYFRWLVPANFEKGPAQFFNGAPPEQREAIKKDVLERVRAGFLARGIGRHNEQEITLLAERSLDALEVFIGDKPYLMGDQPCGADAFVFSTLAGTMTPYFTSPVRESAIARPRLVAYVSRMMDRFYPEFEWDAGITAKQAA